MRLDMFYIFAVRCQSEKTKVEEEFQCPLATGSGNYADPATCKRFYQVMKQSII